MTMTPNRSDLAEAQQIPTCQITGFHALSVDPAGGVGVPPDLHVLAQLFGPDRAALVQQFAYLLEDERVALERGGVVGFLVPQVAPDVFGLGGAPNTLVVRHRDKPKVSFGCSTIQSPSATGSCGAPARISRSNNGARSRGQKMASPR
jgi:hypothetical protein